MGAWDFDDLTRRLQNAAFEPHLWPEALGVLSRTVGGAGAVLIAVDRRLALPQSSPEIGHVTEAYLTQGWKDHDLRFRGVPLLERNGMFTDHDLVQSGEMETSPYYKDFLEPHGLKWAAGIGFRAGGDLWCLSIQRSIAQGPFEPAEYEQLKTLWRPFSDAATLSRQFDTIRISAMTDALQLVNHAALVCDHRGRISGLNAAAERLVGSLLDGKDKTLVFRDAPSADAFKTLVASAIRGAATGCTTPLTAVVRDRTGAALRIRAVSLVGSASHFFSSARVLMLVEREKIAVETVLTTTYGLTPAELRVGLALARGMGLDGIAKESHVKVATVRNQMKSIYAKTGTHRQNQFVALFASFGAEPKA